MRFASGRRSKWVVLAVWLVALGAAAPYVTRLGSIETNNPAAYLPAGAESTEVIRLQERYGAGRIAPAVVVYRNGDGLTPGDRSAAIPRC